jgi:hypothetical protein
MTDTSTNNTSEPEARRFPLFTVLATLATLFLFVALMMVAYKSPGYLNEAAQPAEPKPDPAAKLAEVRAKNQAILDGNPATGTKMSVQHATAELLGKLKSDKDTLPFPMPEPAPPPAPEPKKK